MRLELVERRAGLSFAVLCAASTAPHIVMKKRIVVR
jgi:hypothetical protein